ncbi:MAG: hypothetical protein AAGA25_07970 [Planctomycetota bacterium]
MSLTLTNVTSTPYHQQRFNREANSTIQRLNAGVTVRPKDDPAGFIAYELTRSRENQLKTASINAERAQAFGAAALDQLNQVETTLQQLRDLYVQDAGNAGTQKRIDTLLDQLDHAQTAQFKGQDIFSDAAATPSPPPYTGPRGESKRLEIEQLVSDQNTRVDFAAPIKDAVVIANLSSFNGSAPAHIRVADVDQNGVDLHIEEFEYDDGLHATETVEVLALEAGSYTLESGQKVQVGHVLADGHDTRIEFDQEFDAPPIILTTVQTANDPTAVVVRQTSFDKDGFNIYLQEEEALGRAGHGQEIVGFIAIEAGAGQLGGLEFIAGQTRDSVTHTHHTIDFGQSLEDVTFFSSLATTDGADTASVRTVRTSDTGATVFVEEETSRDGETNHTTEAVAYFALGGTGTIGPTQTPDNTSSQTTALPESHVFAITPELAFNQTTMGIAAVDAQSLGDSTHTLADLATGQSLSYQGDRGRAVQVIDAALKQVDQSVAQTQTFVRTTVGSIENVNRTSLAASKAFREQLENRAGQEVAEQARRLLLRSAGQTLVQDAQQAQADTLLSLIEQTSGTRTNRHTTDSALRSVQGAQQSQLAEALGRFTQEMSLQDPVNAQTDTLGNQLDVLG